MRPGLFSRMRSAFWALPAAMVVGSVVVAVVMTEVDQVVPREYLVKWPRLFGAGAEGSRAMLGAIAGSMVTIASVTFSITMLTLSQTSSQYSPRVLRNFMTDRSTQVVLGVFLSVFVYCLVVLRTISSGENRTFLPSISVTLGGVFALTAMGFFVFFIHHMATSLQASSIIQAAGLETLSEIERLFPNPFRGVPEMTGEQLCQDEGADVADIRSPQTGYVNSIDEKRLLKCAVQRSAAIRASVLVGEFVIAGQTVGRIFGATREGSLHEQLSEAFIISGHRDIHKDPAFGIQQLGDIALKALSPGVNDPTTAIMSIEYLAAILQRIAERDISPHVCHDNDGRARVEIPERPFSDFVNLCFGPVRAATQDPVVLGKIAASIEAVARKTASGERHSQLAAMLQQLSRAAASIAEPDDRHSVESAIRAAHSNLLVDV